MLTAGVQFIELANVKSIALAGTRTTVRLASIDKQNIKEVISLESNQ